MRPRAARSRRPSRRRSALTAPAAARGLRRPPRRRSPVGLPPRIASGRAKRVTPSAVSMEPHPYSSDDDPQQCFRQSAWSRPVARHGGRSRLTSPRTVLRRRPPRGAWRTPTVGVVCRIRCPAGGRCTIRGGDEPLGGNPRPGSAGVRCGAMGGIRAALLNGRHRNDLLPRHCGRGRALGGVAEQSGVAETTQGIYLQQDHRRCLGDRRAQGGFTHTATEFLTARRLTPGGDPPDHRSRCGVSGVR